MAKVKKAYKIITFATTTAAMAMESFCSVWEHWAFFPDC